MSDSNAEKRKYLRQLELLLELLLKKIPLKDYLLKNM